jgi:Tfp pilus assembly protein PilZ
MPESRLVLLTKTPQARAELTRELEILKDEFPNLVISGLDLSLSAAIADKSPQAIVLDLEDWTPSDELVLLELRSRGYAGPILILSKRAISVETPDKGVPDRDVVLVKPFARMELLGIVRRMILAPLVASRRHTRHPTNEMGELRIPGKQGFLPCRVRNLSKGGAYIELEHPLSLRIGDELVVKVRLAAMGRSYEMRARVAWMNARGTGLGVEFASS